MIGRGLVAFLMIAAAVWWWLGSAPDSTVEPAGRTGDRDRAPTTRDGDALPRLSGSDTPPAQHPLQHYLLAETGPARDSVFLAMIRDAGFVCDDIASASELIDEVASWRISCGKMQAYLLEVDSLGELRIEPLLYDDRLPPVPIEAVPAPNR